MCELYFQYEQFQTSLNLKNFKYLKTKLVSVQCDINIHELAWKRLWAPLHSWTVEQRATVVFCGDFYYFYLTSKRDTRALLHLSCYVTAVAHRTHIWDILNPDQTLLLYNLVSFFFPTAHLVHAFNVSFV